MSLKFATLYLFFALLATAANIGTQDWVIHAYGGAFALTFSIAAGTAMGLVVKYLLDKRFIFRFRALDAAHDRRTFMLYTFMGLATTAIFWGVEFGFEHAFGTREMRYLGGIGLGLGYLAKYHLDKRFVFLKQLP
jgi:putative flippase GtrA